MSQPAHNHHDRAGLSLRARFTLCMMLAFAVIELAGGAIFLVYQRRSIDEYFNERVSANMTAMANAIATWNGPIDDADLRRVAAETRVPGSDIMLFTLFDEQGAIIASTSRPALDARAIPEPREPESVLVQRSDGSAGELDHDPLLRVAAERFQTPGGRRYVLKGGSTDVYALGMFRMLNRVLAVLLPTGIIAAGFATWVIAGYILLPLMRLSGRVGTLSPETVRVPLETTSPSREVARLEDELEGARQRLAAGFAAQERFVANVSHELKTPIATLLAESQTLRLGPEGKDPETVGFIKTVQEEMLKLGRLIDSFLVLTRLRAGSVKVRARRHAVNELVMEALSACRADARQKQIVLDASLAEGDDADTQVEGDGDLLRSMIENLVRNAIRFSPPGGLITLAARRDGATVSLSVTDQGPGIPGDQLAAVFDRFSSKGPGAGRGNAQVLGLQIAQGIAELHGGSITATNRPGGGCELVVTLTAKESTVLEPAPSTPSR